MDAIETFFYHICKMDTKTKQFLILYNHKIHRQTQINIRIEVMNTLINYYFFCPKLFQSKFSVFATFMVHKALFMDKC